MASLRAAGDLCVALLLTMVYCASVVCGFSDGKKLSSGSSATRALYCNRSPNRRGPLHFHANCNGFCEPRQDFARFYTLNVSHTTYWLNVVTVNISAKPESGKAVTGFSIYAIDEANHVAGAFVEDDTDVVVGSCNDIIAITDETHAGFHRMADPDRKNVSIQWQPDGYNHGRTKFVLWVVNNHSDVYYAESQWLTSEKHGSDTLDVATSLKKIVKAVDMKDFENSFNYRSRKGYQLDLTNPFSLFSKSPSKSELVPANTTLSGDFQTGGAGTPTTSITGSASDGNTTSDVPQLNDSISVNNNSNDSAFDNTTNTTDIDMDNFNSNKLKLTNENDTVNNSISSTLTISNQGDDNTTTTAIINSNSNTDNVTNSRTGNTNMFPSLGSTNFPATTIGNFESISSTASPSGGTSGSTFNTSDVTAASGLSTSDVKPANGMNMFDVTPTVPIDVTPVPGLGTSDITTSKTTIYPKIPSTPDTFPTQSNSGLSPRDSSTSDRNTSATVSDNIL